MELQRTLKMLDKQKNLLAESHRIAKMGSWEYDLQNRVLTWSDEIFGILPDETVLLMGSDVLGSVSLIGTKPADCLCCRRYFLTQY